MALLTVFCCLGGAARGVSPAEAEHAVVYFKPGRFGGWPANHSIWSWGGEILVVVPRGYSKNLGPDRRERKERKGSGSL